MNISISGIDYVILNNPGQKLSLVEPLTNLTYTPYGMTALYDAIAHSIQLADESKDNYTTVVCAVITDGLENYSRNTTKAMLKQMIGRRVDSNQWYFLYIGVNHEVFRTDFGLPLNYTLPFTPKEISGNFMSLNQAVKRGRTQLMMREQGGFDRGNAEILPVSYFSFG